MEKNCRCGGFKASWAKEIICSICHKPLPSLDEPQEPQLSADTKTCVEKHEHNFIYIKETERYACDKCGLKLSAEEKECFHEWEFYSTSSGNIYPDLIEQSYKCRKCGEFKFTNNEPEPLKMIEELKFKYRDLSGKEQINNSALWESLIEQRIEQLQDKLNEIIQQINGGTE